VPSSGSCAKRPTKPVLQYHALRGIADDLPVYEIP
jgi:hypothetical protein